MVFVGIYRAIYDYAPQSQGELAIAEGELVFVVEKSGDDDWWKAKKRALNDQEEEPEGLIPNNYVEEAAVKSHAKALYDYARQTDEELSFQEDAVLDIYDTSEDDWTLVGLDGEFGFVPSNYIEATDGSDVPPPMPSRPRNESAPATDYPSPAASPPPSAAAALAGIIHQKTGASDRGIASPPPAAQFTPDASDEEAPPPMPRRPASQQMSPTPQPISPPTQYASPRSSGTPGIMASPKVDEQGGYHLYNIHEMISHMGRNKKMPTTLGINIAKGTILIAPERSRDGPQKEWTAEKLTHYSIEGKHVFMELVKPSQSIDFHAGAKDTAQEIVAALGELAGAARAEGLREVIAATAGSGQKKGKMLYEFMAQGDDEVTVAVDDEVIVLDDAQSAEWWMVRRLKNGNEGVVPSSYVEITGVIAAEPLPPPPAPVPTAVEPSRSKSSRSSRKEEARLEEERLAREALSSGSRGQEVGPGLPLPDRHSSLGQRDNDDKRSGQRSKRGSRSESKSTSSKPEPSKIRTWTDRTGTFKVEAQFLGLKDGKINLHKVNGVKIAVAIGKMSLDDIEYVERETGLSLDEEKPLSEIRRKNTEKRNERASPADTRRASNAQPSSGAAVQPQKPEYDWFDFFLVCGVNPQICERYASAFNRDQMGEEVMQDIDPTLLRTLGLKEGDILRVMKFLDNKYGRVRERSAATNGDADTNGDGLFSGPGGALRNNTRKGRPAPAIQNNDTVDPRAFEQSELKAEQPPATTPTPLTPAPPPAKAPVSSFDDDAWDVKPSKQATPPRAMSPPVQAPVQRPAPTGAMSDLSLLSPPLQPTVAPQVQRPQPTGADPSLFEQLSQPAPPRQRPQPPQQPIQSSLIPPPPSLARPTSAPQNQQQNTFAPPPLRPQMTGTQPQIAPPGQSLGELNQQRMMQQMYPQQTGFQYPQQTGYQQPVGYQSTGFSNQQQLMNGQANGSPFADPPRAPYQPIQMQQTGYQSMQPQQTGINNFLPPALQPQRTGMNGYQQPNGFQSQQTGFQQPQGYPQNNMQPQQQQQQQQQQQPNGQSNFNQPYNLQPQQTGYALQPQQTGFSLQPQQTGYGQSAFSQAQAPPLPPIPQQHQTLPPLQPQKTGPPPPVRFGVTSPGAKKLMAQPTGRRANLASATPQNPFGF